MISKNLGKKKFKKKKKETIAVAEKCCKAFLSANINFISKQRDEFTAMRSQKSGKDSPFLSFR